MAISPERALELAHTVRAIETCEEVITLVAVLVRRISPLHLADRITSAQRARDLGPLLNPSAWLNPQAVKEHNANIDVLNRLMDFLQSVKESDRVCGNPSMDYLPDPDNPLKKQQG